MQYFNKYGVSQWISFTSGLWTYSMIIIVLTHWKPHTTQWLCTACRIMWYWHRNTSWQIPRTVIFFFKAFSVFQLSVDFQCYFQCHIPTTNKGVWHFVWIARYLDDYEHVNTRFPITLRYNITMINMSGTKIGLFQISVSRRYSATTLHTNYVNTFYVWFYSSKTHVISIYR